MNRPNGVPSDAFREVTVTVARQTLAEAEDIDFDAINISVLARHVGGLMHAVRDLLDVIDDQEAER